MKHKIALLSNVNLSFAIRMLKREFVIYEGEGYGNELGELLNPDSSYHAFAADITFIVMDLMELIEHDLKEDGSRMDKWFGSVRAAVSRDRIYFISDACLWGAETSVLQDGDRKRVLEGMWQERLNALCREYPGVHVLPYRSVLEEMGFERAFSLKMWYMGRMLHTNDAQKELCGLITDRMQLLDRTAKKVLLLDLDHTLWGGLAGETDHTPIILSDDHDGLAFKNLQRVIAQMQSQGVLLGIVSKNNEEDALKILAEHPHMVLRPEQFAARKINWEPKHRNIQEIARELNLGTDSFVFWDDSPAERDLVKKMLPEVIVPDFPEQPEELAPAMADIYKQYFAKLKLTKEDLEKTGQYAANTKRNQLQEESTDFESYLKQLKIEIIREDVSANQERLLQLINKTNQFNLTTRRLDAVTLQQLIADKNTRVFLYRVTDCFGDNGIVAAGIVNLGGEEPVLDELVMSCRVMGRRIEYAIVEDIENALKEEGYTVLRGLYYKTARNKPVEKLYESLGYQLLSIDENKGEYRMVFSDRPKRVYYANIVYDNIESVNSKAVPNIFGKS